MENRFSNATSPSKRIAVIGAGAAGLVALKTLCSTPEFNRGEWEVFCFERRHALGGIWLPDPMPPKPPALPQTPLYPSLTTNLPHPIMAFRDFAFPPSTPLYPSASTVLDYLNAYAKSFALSTYIKLNTMVEKIEFTPVVEGDQSAQPPQWNIVTRDLKTNNSVDHRHIDTLVIANGRHNLPHFPLATSSDASQSGLPLPGLTQWLDSDCASHAMYYRTPPEKYRGRTILVVGDGPSARDIAPEIASVAKVVWRSVRRPPIKNPETGGLTDITVIASPGADPAAHDRLPIHFCGPIASLGPPRVDEGSDSNPNVFLEDGDTLSVDYIVFATGYELSFPFLPEGVLEQHHIPFDPSNSHDVDAPLLLYSSSLSPLLHHLLPSSLRLPLGSLFVLGLPRPVVPFPLVQAQCHLLVAVLQGNGQIHHLLDEQKSSIGKGPFYGGSIDAESTKNIQEHSRHYHLFASSNDQFDYRESLVLLCLSTMNGEENKEQMVPKWQRRIYGKKDVLRAIWRDIERRGVAEEMTREIGKGGEDEWVDFMEKLLSDYI